ncbi:MAG: tetratricopeptide repeat protein, partial [Deltaproteobacteria bacterium]|nr:tetratricopeptide repeat protein [Deltaproteobacteria bacterium]
QAEDGLNEMTLLYMSGHLEEALLIGHASLERLERTGFAEGIADAKSRVGSLLSIAGRHAAARTMLEQAYFSAGAMKDDEVAAAAARHLAGIGAGPAPHGIEWVRGWASHASMLHARLGMSSSFEEAEVHESLAAALADVDSPGSQPEEIELIGKARDIRASLVGEDHPAVLVADINLAVYAAQEDPHVPLDRIRSAGKRLRLALGPGHPTMVSMHLMTGGILAERGQLTEALADMDRAITLSVDVNGPDHPQTMRAREIREEVMALRQP